MKPTYEELEQRIRNLEKTQNDLLSINFEHLLENSTDFIYFKDIDHRFILTSKSFAKITGHNNWRDLIGKSDYDIFPKKDADHYYNSETSVINGDIPILVNREMYLRAEGDEGWVDTHKWPIKDKNGVIVGLFGISRDITDLVRAEESLTKLEGIIPICMHCKEIKDDKGSWNQLEKYISEHSNAKFSHGICDKCQKKYYPEIFNKQKNT